MVPPLRGVSSAVSCSGTQDQGSLFRFRVPSNYSVVVVIWTFVPHAIYTCHVIGAKCCKAWDTHLVLKTRFFFIFQILISYYEPFISLPFFSHYPGDRQSHEAQTKSDWPFISCMQTLLDSFTPCTNPPRILSGLRHNGKHRLGILNTRQGEVCMVAPPLLDVQCFFIF